MILTATDHELKSILTFFEVKSHSIDPENELLYIWFSLHLISGCTIRNLGVQLYKLSFGRTILVLGVQFEFWAYNSASGRTI